VAKLSQYVRSTHNQDGGIVLDICQGRIFALNPLGSRILSSLEAGIGPERIIDGLIQEFGVSREIIEADVQEFLATLREYCLLEGRTNRRLV
jgi:Coenzyme PQQ synthesis protein D (PqqD)